MSVINTNVKALVAQNSLNINNRNMSNTMEQLSTGKRINSAADDAAGLAISNKMTSQVRGLNQAVRNANDSVALLQTAEGAMVEITNMMQRMRELAVQSANDTNTSDDRGYLDLEFQQLKEEANRITRNTQFNGMNLLDGSFTENDGVAGKFTFQVGANANQSISHTIGQLEFSGTAATATATMASAIAGGVQTSTLTLASGATATVPDWKAGDVITVKLGNDQLQYTVKDADVDGLVAADAITAIGDGIAAAFLEAKDEGRFANVATGVNTAGVIAFTGEADVSFAATATASSGKLASIDSLDVLNLGTSNDAITGLDNAIKVVNEARAEIGSNINRLNFAADNLTNVSMNTAASRSNILDTNYAQATTELARTQIIQQAATAMLAQANQQPASVLSLLQ